MPCCSLACLIVAMLMLMPLAPHAALITLETDARASISGVGIGGLTQVMDNQSFDSTVQPIAGTKTASATATNAGASVTATTSTSLSAGTIKNLLAPTVSSTGFFGFGSAKAAVRGQVVAAGSGDITFFLDVSGLWNLTAVPVTAGFPTPQVNQVTVDARFQVTGPLGAQPLDQFLTVSPLFNDSVAERLQSTIAVSAGDTIRIDTSLLTNVQGASGIVDFSNTASLGYFSPDGVALSFPDDGFLSNAAAIPVPLPGVLLAGSLAFAAGLAVRRGRP